MISYCQSRFRYLRHKTREVMVGGIAVGGDNPIRIQSMTNTQTLDIKASVRQVIDLAEAGCEIVRLTAQNVAAARALGTISKQVRAAGYDTPLVADIHFLPAAAMEAVEHVEKVRINPGNYADKKKFAIREYSDEQYELELKKLQEAVSPFFLRCRELGRAVRIGTNHGSLSDRIMNRYGDTPEGMVESAMEFLRIARMHQFHDIILSMKASNPKVMIQAYRLVVARMSEEAMNYPLHLGVTEAGDGEDARIKSAIGIGSLLFDGMGDTIRVSLTEDPVAEVPVARDLVTLVDRLRRRTKTGFSGTDQMKMPETDSVDPYHYIRRDSIRMPLGPGLEAGGNNPPVVLTRIESRSDCNEKINQLLRNPLLRDSPVEGFEICLKNSCPENDSGFIHGIRNDLIGTGKIVIWNLEELAESHEDFDRFVTNLSVDYSDNHLSEFLLLPAHGYRQDKAQKPGYLNSKIAQLNSKGIRFAVPVNAAGITELVPIIRQYGEDQFLLTPAVINRTGCHPVGEVRKLVEALREARIRSPLWLRFSREAGLCEDSADSTLQLMDAAIYMGSLLCDGIGDLVSISTTQNSFKAVRDSYNILQGARARISKTEFVACPSCGRTLFDLQSTTNRIRERTKHLKGVTIAIMGCIVNGPGEMADADFGYVGGTPGKVNLYVGKKCVEFHIPEKEAVDRLIQLIRKEGKWVDA